MKKHTRDLESLITEERNMGSAKSISEACIDYMELEFAEKISSIDDNMKDHVQQRLRTGKAAIVVVDEIRRKGKNDDGFSVIEGTLKYDKLPYSNPGKILSALRLKEEKGKGTGSFVKGIKISKNNLTKEVTKQYNLKDCPTFIVKELSISDSETDSSGRPVTGEITLELIPIQDEKFSKQSYPINTSGSSDGRIQEEDAILIDEGVTDFQKQSAYYTLKNSEYSSLSDLLEGMRRGEENNKTNRFDKKKVEELTSWMKNDNSNVLPVNKEQQSFIEDVESEISLLQGPPGTGKTSGGIAPAILGRLLSKDDGVPCRILVTGASNKSIDEVLSETVKLLDKYQESELTTDELDNVLLHRANENSSLNEIGLTNPPYSPDVTFTEPRSDTFNEDGDRLVRRLKRNINKTNTNDAEHVVTFATPRKVWNIGRKTNVIEDFAFGLGEEEITKQATDIRKDQHNIFDVIIADEASMMNVPLFLLTGSFYDGNGNIILSGDHRQLPPVSEYEWEEDYKPSIRHKVPYVSALDFFRLLSGDEIKSIDDDKKDLINIATGEEANIPLHQLKKTYRCHETIAAFLKKWVYKKLDDINYTSTQTDTITTYETGVQSIDEALTSDNALTVITYDDTKHQQTNEIETSITTELLKATKRDTTTGVITPHNAQRALLESQIKMNENEINSNPDVDTVERFQGGERDLMIVNATVSDPDYIKQEEKFLLSLNRLNVAMSRMKKKLIVIASESIFDHIPNDTNDYNNALLWKGLATEAGLSTNEEPAWSGKLHEITDTKQLPTTLDGTINIEIHHTDIDT